MSSRPMLGDLELPQVQELESAADEVYVQHAVPGLEGDFLQDHGRRASAISLAGVLTGPEAGDALKSLRQSFHAAEPVDFAADIATATKIDKVLIEEMDLRDLAGKPERFEYLLRLRELIEPPEPEEEAPPPDEVPPPDAESATLVVQVVVEGRSDFDFADVTVTVEGTKSDGDALSQTLTNRSEDVWTEEGMPPGSYTAKASVDDPAMTGSASADVRAGQTTRVTITLRPVAAIAKVFVVHFRFDRAFVEPCMRTVLSDAVKHAEANPEDKLLIVGHCDKTGSDNYNQSLSERRARSVYAFLSFGRDRANALKEWNELRRPATGGLPSLHDGWGTGEYQQILQDLRKYSGAIDRDHGPDTDAAVRSFQQEKGLPVNGVVGDATWAALIEAYLSQDGFAVPETRFLPNCSGEILKWVGCGEEDPVKSTEDAFRPNRRVELMFVRAAALPSKVAPPATFDLPAAGAVASGWCVGAAGDPRTGFATPANAPDARPSGAQWGRVAADPETITVAGSVVFDDGSPAADLQYLLIASDGEFMDGEVPAGERRGEGVPGRTKADGTFAYPAKPKRAGIFVLEILGPFVARLKDQPPESAKGRIVCRRLKGALRFDVVVSRAVRLEIVHRNDPLAPAMTFVRCGLWDNAFDPVTGARRNERTEARNFVGADSRHFFIRLRDPLATGQVEVQWRTLHADGTPDDAPASEILTLTETTAGSHVFVSRAVMLVTDDVDRDQPTDSGLAPPHLDAGQRNRGQSNHRLRRITVDDRHQLDATVSVSFTPSGSVTPVRTSVVLFRRSPEERKRVRVHLVNVRVTPGGNGILTLARRNLVTQTFQAAYGRCGIFAEVDEILLDPPASCIGWPLRYPTDPIAVDPSVEESSFPGGVNLVASGSQNDLIDLVRALPTFDAKALYIFCVAHIYSAPVPAPPGPGLADAAGGESFPDSWIAAGSTAGGMAFVAVSGVTEFADVHEATHITTNLRNVAGGHYDLGAATAAAAGPIDGKNLMNRFPLGNGGGVANPKRMWNTAVTNTARVPALVNPAQIDAITASRFTVGF